LGLRINIVTSGRFHVLDLARELAALGHDVRFYSCLPRSRATRFGLPARCHRRALLALLPLFALVGRGPAGLQRWLDAALKSLIDLAAAALTEPCDVFIGMSGLCVASARAARARGAKVFLERGSRHIASQKAVLEAMPGGGLRAVSASDVRRELAGYALADAIVVPSRHVERSFIENGVLPERIFRDPYGVDLAMFPPTPRPAQATPVVMMAGTWSLRKGCDLLWAACEAASSWRLLHVGPLGDAPLPRSPLFEHVGPVPQWQLKDALARSDVFALASREEGLALVQAQALSCGLPLVCTDRTGGEDLRELLDDPRWVIVVPHDDARALGRGIEEAIALSRAQRGLRDILGAARNRLSWAAYARRYDEELARRCSP
jgi:alpha-maltose-1-phosphate synthase